MKYKHLFGPISSRRLGVSLGVDLIPYKYCPLNCVYCEVQSTTHLTSKRQEFFPIREILDELDAALKDIKHLDYITFSGAGEPTLYSKIGEIVSYIKTHYPNYKLALITNSILLGDPALRKEVELCDLALPSLDAVSQEVFEQINRPEKGILSVDIVQALIDFRKDFAGQIWLEVFIIPGINDRLEELELISSAIGRIKPDRVQINSLDRPGTEDWVHAPSPEKLEEIRDFFSLRLSCPVEIISSVHYQSLDQSVDQGTVEQVKLALQNASSSAEELSQKLGIHINEISKTLRQLHQDGAVSVIRNTKGVFYQWIS